MMRRRARVARQGGVGALLLWDLGGVICPCQLVGRFRCMPLGSSKAAPCARRSGSSILVGMAVDRPRWIRWPAAPAPARSRRILFWEARVALPSRRWTAGPVVPYPSLTASVSTVSLGSILPEMTLRLVGHPPRPSIYLLRVWSRRLGHSLISAVGVTSLPTAGSRAMVDRGTYLVL